MDRKQLVQTPVAAFRALRFACLVVAACVTFACGRTDADNGPTTDGGVTDTAGSPTEVNIHGCPERYPGSPVTCFRCDPLPAGSTEGCAAPAGCGASYDKTSSLRYPEGCYVVFPWKNDWYPDYSQAAYCDPRSGWVCLH